MKGKNIFAGIALILFAVALMVDRMGIYPDMPLLKIGVSLLLILAVFSCLRKWEFAGATFSLGLIAIMFSKELGISQVSPWIIIIVSILVGAGLSLIFGKNKVYSVKCKKDGEEGSVSTEYSLGEDNFHIENNFGSKTEYVSVKNLKAGHLENAFGSLTVYLNGTTLDEKGAALHEV